MKFTGFSELTSPHDLLNKAKRDFDKMRADKSNVDLAFNFFVTIEHMPDWLGMNRKEIKEIKNGSAVLRVCSHLACGAKHFEPFESYKSIKSVQTDSVYEDGVYEDGIYEKCLVINLGKDEALEFGISKLDAMELGERVIKYWEVYPERCKQP